MSRNLRLVLCYHQFPQQVDIAHDACDAYLDEDEPYVSANVGAEVNDGAELRSNLSARLAPHPMVDCVSSLAGESLTL